MKDDITRMIKDAIKQIESNLPLLEDEIDIIIRNQDKSLQRIERVLDTLLSCLYMGIGEVQFNRLNSYYATFNKKNAGKYAKFYHEIIDR